LRVSATLANSVPDAPRDLSVAVIRLPHMDNFTDVVPLAAEPDVSVRYIDRVLELAGADMVLLPGSKNTVADLAWLKEGGLAEAVVAHSRSKGATIGLCGGYQMLGATLEDGPGVFEGLGLLSVTTRFLPGKQTTLTVVEGISGLLGAWSKGGLTGYENDSGMSTLQAGARPAFRVITRGGAPADETDGCMDRGGWTFGTYLHGLFDNDIFRRRYLNALRARKGLPPLVPGTPAVDERERA
jgi:adenosylcobyric acid synthase